jgi:CubicO group peptidase (beta-lactamase class C family)
MRRLIAACAIATLTVALTGQDPLPRATPESVGLAAAPLRDATTLLRRYVDEHKVAGAVAAVARRGRLAYLEAVGVQNIGSRTPMSDLSLFRIYSMTKSVTAVAVMMLFEQGRFALSDPVSRYLPEFATVTVATGPGSTRPPARPMTIEDLLLHTSGLNHRTSEQYRRADVRSRSIPLPLFIHNIVAVPLMEDPGTRYRYSESPTVLGRLIEVWSGKAADRFLSESVFGPLGMLDTGFWADDARAGRLTTVYATTEGGALRPIEIEDVPFTERPALIEGAVGLLSTVPDYLRFCQMLLNKGQLGGVRLLRPETVESMTRNRLSDGVLRMRGGGMGWGLANVNVVMDPDGLGYPADRGEYGWDGSAGTIFWIDPAKELVTILMTQSSPSNPDSLRQRFKTLVEHSVVD